MQFFSMPPPLQPRVLARKKNLVFSDRSKEKKLALNNLEITALDNLFCRYVGVRHFMRNFDIKLGCKLTGRLLKFKTRNPTQKEKMQLT